MEKKYNNYFADYIEGKITDIELKEKVSEKEYLAIRKIAKSFDVIAELETPMDNTLASIKNKIAQQTKPAPKKTKIISLISKWAISVAAALLIFVGIRNYFGNNDVNIYANFGEQKTIALLDDSEVILNAKSTIKYNKSAWKNKRELFLDGEAYFKVTKGSTFTVNTKNGNVTVLGTHFNVISKGDYFRVICYEGKVKVVSDNTTNILTPGKGVLNLNTKNETFEITTNEPTWFKGYSEFTNAPLTLVISELEKQFKLTFDTTNVDTSREFTGSFNNKNLKKALAAVFIPMEIHYKTVADKIILSKAK